MLNANVLALDSPKVDSVKNTAGKSFVTAHPIAQADSISLKDTTDQTEEEFDIDNFDVDEVV